MAIEWFNASAGQGIATIYSSYVTLNTIAMKPLHQADKLMIGIDHGQSQLVIKPLGRAEVLRGDLDTDNMIDFTINKSYARVAKTRFINEVKHFLQVDFHTPRKFVTTWDDQMRVIRIHLKEEIK